MFKFDIQNLFFGYKDEHSVFQFILQVDKNGSKTPFGKISLDRVTDFLAGRKARFFALFIFKEDNA